MNIIVKQCSLFTLNFLAEDDEWANLGPEAQSFWNNIRSYSESRPHVKVSIFLCFDKKPIFYLNIEVKRIDLNLVDKFKFHIKIVVNPQTNFLPVSYQLKIEGSSSYMLF